MTKRLYYEDAYCREFDARVTGCREGKRGWEVTLDQTAFYPEGEDSLQMRERWEKRRCWM